jgi:hypothetical protein
MSDRASIEKEVSDSKQAISQLDKDIQQLRDWIRTNERAVGGMPESLRRITEDGITRAPQTSRSAKTKCNGFAGRWRKIRNC